MLDDEGHRLRRVVVCTPRRDYFQAGDPKTHNFNEPPEPSDTLEQHGLLKATLARRGCDVVDVPELPGHPNSVFTRDVALVTPRGYVKLRMGLGTRRGEEEWMSELLESLGEPRAASIEEPGTVEGGDVMLAGAVAFLGLSARTNAAGVEQLARILSDMDYEVRVVPVPSACLHLGGAISALGPGRVLCCRRELPAAFLRGFDTIAVPRRGPSSGNVICVGDGEVIANSAENAEAIELLENGGVTVHRLDLSEFRKGAGGPSCLVLPLERG
jgi:dimethylargininase